MAFRKKTEYKDPLGDLGSDISDISEVKSEELNKYIKSATDLDSEIFSADIKGTPGQAIVAVPGEKKKGIEAYSGLSFHSSITRKPNDDPLVDFDLLSDEDDPPLKGISKLNLDSAKDDKQESQFASDSKSRGRGSGDWLGLKGTPEKPPNQLETKPDPLDILKSNTKMKSDISKDSISRQMVKSADSLLPEKKEPVVRPSARKRVNILDDLFGDTLNKKEEPKFNINDIKSTPGIVGPGNDSIEKIELDSASIYTPSLATGRRVDRRKELTNPSKLGFDSDIDWVLGPKTAATSTENKIDESISKAVTAPLQQPQRYLPKENPFPEWLSSTKGQNHSSLPVVQDPQNPKPTLQPPLKDVTASQVPEWLGGATNLVPQSEVVQGESLQNLTTQEESTPNVPQPGEDVVSVIGQLANVKVQLGAAMARHNQTLQNYMQVLVNEAQRVSFAEQLLGHSYKLPTPNNEASEEESEEKKFRRKEEQKKMDENAELISQKDDIIHDQQVKISRLEMEITQLELKIENLETMKNLEIENLKQAHGFELEAWENRFERTKKAYEEIVEDYEAKISKLRKREEESEKESKERLNAVQADRLADLTKMGEFHRAAFERASIPYPPLSSNMMPSTKYTQRPGDEVELTDREATLIEKEKQIEILKAELTAQKNELDEAIEREKVKREEREREMRRVMMEAKFKEELSNKDIERRKEQLEVQETQLGVMRDEALKEQTQLAKDKLILAAERARLDATLKIEKSDQESLSLHPLDMMKARTELEAALEVVREARELADQERRRLVEMRKVAEEITWEQKDKDQQLEMRERHIHSILKDAEATKEEGLMALEKAEIMKREVEAKEREVRELLIQIEVKEKGLAKERLEVAKEKMELEKQKSLLEALLPTLNQSDELKINPPKVEEDKGYVDPKALIMRLRAERDLEAFINPLRKNQMLQ